MRQPRVFISCSRADQTLAAKLSDYLRRAYDEVWFDEHRYGGEVWWDEILWNIRACDLFIYLVSPQSIRASYCQAEYTEAVRLRKQILPIVIRPVMVIPSVFRPLRPLDMTKGIGPTTVGEALSALKRLENRLPNVPQPPLSAEPTPMPLVEEEAPRHTRWRLFLPPLFGIALLLLWAVPRLAAPPSPATPTGKRFVPTATLALPAVTVILMTPTQAPILQPTRTAILATQAATATSTLTATASRVPSLTSTFTPTATPSITPTLPTSTSTVPPTVTRRVTATRVPGG